MTADALLIGKCVFTDILRLFTFIIPGTHMTPLEWAFLVLTCLLVFRVIRNLFSGYHSTGGSGEE